MKFSDIFSLAFRTVRSNKLRTGITVAIIAFGIMALVGINTAIDAMKQKFTESFAAMGSNGFTLHYKDFNFFRGHRRGDDVKKEKKGGLKEKKSNTQKIITKEQAEDFKKRFDFPSKVGLSLRGTNDAVLSFGDKKSTPTVWINGGDENFAELNGFGIDAGRNLNDLDVQSGRNVCMIGSDIVKRFFNGNAERSIDKIIKINNIPYRIVGALEEKGSTLGRSWDNSVVTSYNNVRRFFNGTNSSFTIQVKVPDVRMVDAAIGEATGIFRRIRKLNTTEADNFVIDKSDRFVEELLKNLSFVTVSAVVIGFITLVGAAVGLMNIMLVAVTERTKEIGLVKAIGARQGSIRRQFLYESILISMMGAVFGVILGVIVGNSFAIVLKTDFVIPWDWMLYGTLACSVVGLLAGLYPSLKAARLNPIEALRYE